MLLPLRRILPGRTPGLARYLEWRVMCLWRIAVDSTEGIERVEVVRLPEGSTLTFALCEATAERTMLVHETSLDVGGQAAVGVVAFRMAAGESCALTPTE